MIIEQLLLSMETVQLARIDKFIRRELQRRAEYAIKFGVHDKMPVRLTKSDKKTSAKPL